MLISQPRITEIGGRATLTADISGRQLWFSVPAAYGKHLTDSSDPFLVATLLAAMKVGAPVEIRGSISARLRYNLPRLMRLLSELIKGFRPVEIKSSTHGGSPSAGVASGFSGGVDSFCLIADHMHEPVKLTHLVYNKVGAHASDKVFREHFERLLPTAGQLGLPMLSIESNVNDFVPCKFQQSHTLRNVSALLVLQSLFGKYLYASTYPYRAIFVGRTYDMAYMDPLILPLLSTERMECISVGSEYSRVEKTLRVADVPASFDTLDVCVRPQKVEGRPNCSECWKCCRTQLTLEIAGKLHLYDRVFDLDIWRKARRSYLHVVRSSRSDPLLREVTDFAKTMGYRMPSMPVSLAASRIRGAAQLAERKAMELAPRRLKDVVKRFIHRAAAT